MSTARPLVGLDTIGRVASNGAQGFTWLVFLAVALLAPGTPADRPLASPPGSSRTHAALMLIAQTAPMSIRPLRWWSIPLFAAAVAALSAIASLGRHSPPPRPVANLAFKSAPDERAAAVVWAVGDGADGSAAARRVADRIAADRPQRVLYLGDVYERGSAADFRSRFATVYGRLVPAIAPTPGNHDWPAHLEGYDRYWRSVTGAATPPWYAFRVGGWRVLSLNSEAPKDAGSAQMRWLHRALRRASGGCMLAFWHRPRHSAGKHGDQSDVAPLWNAVRGRATLVINGHDHDMQRLRPRGGTTEVVAGAGGHSRYQVDAGDPRLVFANDRVDGALRLALRPGRGDMRFIAADGTLLDRTTLRCATS